jgi:hypothetical protein
MDRTRLAHPLNDDRSSVLFRDVLGAGDYDRMTEDF